MTFYNSAVGSKLPNGVFNPESVELLSTDFRSAVDLTAVSRASDSQFTTSPTGIDGASGYDMSEWFKAYFGTKTQFYIQQLLAGTAVGADVPAKIADALNHIESKIQSTSLSYDPNARELYTILKKRDTSGNPQAPLLIQRRRDDWGTTNLIPVAPIPSLYWRYDCILDPGLGSFIPGSYMAISEEKGGDLPQTYLDQGPNATTGIGSFRFKLVAYQDSANSVLLGASCDNVANILDVVSYPENYNAQTGFYYAPFTLSSRQLNVGDIVRGKTSLTLGTVSWLRLHPGAAWTSGVGKGGLVITNSGDLFTNGEVLQVQVAGVWTDVCTVAKFWNGLESEYLTDDYKKYHYADMVSVPLGVPLRFEFNIVVPPSRTDLTTGLTQCVVTNLSTGERIVVCDFRGGIQLGAAGDPRLSRVYISNPYSNLNNETGVSDHTTIGLAHRLTNLRVRTIAPYRMT